MFWTIVGAIIFVLCLPLILTVLAGVFIFVVPTLLAIGLLLAGGVFLLAFISEHNSRIIFLTTDSYERTAFIYVVIILIVLVCITFIYRDIRYSGGLSQWLRDKRIILRPAFSPAQRTKRGSAIIRIKANIITNKNNEIKNKEYKKSIRLENVRTKNRDGLIKELKKCQNKFQEFENVIFDYSGSHIRIKIKYSEKRIKEIVIQPQDILRGFLVSDTTTRYIVYYADGWRGDNKKFETARQVRKHVTKMIVKQLSEALAEPSQ